MGGALTQTQNGGPADDFVHPLRHDINIGTDEIRGCAAGEEPHQPRLTCCVQHRADAARTHFLRLGGKECLALSVARLQFDFIETIGC